MDRRNFLHMMGLFSGTTLLSSCGSEGEQKKLISYLVPPEDGTVAGEAVWHPSTCTECPAGCGILVRLRQGRPVKLEGNPGHPINDGALCMRGQAALGRLYHPDRIKTPLRRNRDGGFTPISWDEALDEILSSLSKAKAENRNNLYFSGRTTGALRDLSQEFCSVLGLDKVEYEFYSYAASRSAYATLFGHDDLPRHRVERSDFLLTLGADLLETWGSPVGQHREVLALKDKGGHWYHLEPHISLTGTNADKRINIRPGSENVLLAWLLKELISPGKTQKLPDSILKSLPSPSADEVEQQTGIDSENLDEMLNKLKTSKAPLLIAGGPSTAQKGGTETALLTGLIQWVTGMADELLDFAGGENYGGLITQGGATNLLDNRSAGVVFIAETNPCYQIPGFLKNLEKADFKVGFLDFFDETAEKLDLILPTSHTLESWCELEPRKGVFSLSQPLIEPLGDSRSTGNILLDLLKRSQENSPASDFREYLFARWEKVFSSSELKDFSNRGFLEKLPEPIKLNLRKESAKEIGSQLKSAAPLAKPALILSPSIRTFDGRGRVLPLLSEIPDPLTSITYGSWVSISDGEAKKRGVEEGDLIRIEAGEWKESFAVRIQPGLADDLFVVQRPHLEKLPPLAASGDLEAFACLGGVRVKRTGGSKVAVALSGSLSQDNRGIIPEPVSHKELEKHRHASLYPEHEHPDYRWAMAIDLDLCTGCGACVASCYIENNIPLTGEKEHLKGREMSWIRLEPYYDDEGRAEFVPMLCQHCHNAPCEPVCPVYAAYHNPEGLNVQVYSRCVGTRYCSNNCPYKVRRFNWYRNKLTEIEKQGLNPDVPNRERGMMEKCSFCLQRIRGAKDKAKDEGRKVMDGEVKTACAQSCPAGAIVFGNLLDEESDIFKAAHSERTYRIFDALGTEPSVYYLKKRGHKE